ncbi:MAG: methionine--tRNA ligase [Candidatus Woykebacteria bacterium RBG_13_40_15]|uniref:Methionine--tRNA ligase n=1 Tax=Candidatus Woykebacteria bacterium RBG_13_40_15 TaxID=1802593 RepID=A0A1G1W957_9BACT|nr:MAG: methionine--tRNA ligase [Candidatus Woykebacteria bacterium RBG_13_40_15]
MNSISFEEFKKLDIRMGKVLSCEKVEGSEKLLKLEVDIGTDSSTGSGLGKRQIIAGIAQYYSPEKLIGKNFVFLANLETKKLMGLESQGMILCADQDGEPVCLTSVKEVPPGTIVR